MNDYWRHFAGDVTLDLPIEPDNQLTPTAGRFLTAVAGVVAGGIAQPPDCDKVVRACTEALGYYLELLRRAEAILAKEGVPRP